MNAEENKSDERGGEQFPVQNLRQRLDTVEPGDELDVTYRSRRSGNTITVSGEVTAVKENAGAVWWADLSTEDGRTIRVEDDGDVETVRSDGGTPTLGPVLDFQREGVEEPELMTDGGRSSQAAYEQKMILNALRNGAEQNPGAVVAVGTDRMADLSDEPGHVQKVITDGGTDARGRYRKRVRVMYVAYGAASDVSEQVDSERIPAGDMTPEDIHPSAVRTHVEFIPRERRERLDDHVERVEQYITERWDPDWTDRERVSGQMGDGDE